MLVSCCNGDSGLARIFHRDALFYFMRMVRSALFYPLTVGSATATKFSFYVTRCTHLQGLLPLLMPYRNITSLQNKAMGKPNDSDDLTKKECKKNVYKCCYSRTNWTNRVLWYSAWEDYSHKSHSQPFPFFSRISKYYNL